MVRAATPVELDRPEYSAFLLASISNKLFTPPVIYVCVCVCVCVCEREREGVCVRGCDSGRYDNRKDVEGKSIQRA